jgi:hypothetical protein
MSSLAEVRQRLIEAARRHSRVTHEVEDLAHDIILSALRRGRTLEGEQFLRGIHRAAQQHGAFLARTAVRRRAREHLTAQDLTVHASVRVAPSASRGTALSTLSSALQTTVLLLLQGLEKPEILSALGVSDAAFRKRLQALRAQGPLARPVLPAPDTRPALVQLRRSQVVSLPKLARCLTHDGRAPRVLAAADPDGHGLIFVGVLTPRGGAATPAAPNVGPHSKGQSCSTASSRTSRSSSS